MVGMSNMPWFSTSSRGTASVAGRQIWCTTDGQLNVDDGSSWNKVLDSGNVIVSDVAGPHALGQAAANHVGMIVGGSFTGSGAGTNTTGLLVNQAITAQNGSTTLHAVARVDGSITTQGNSESINVVSSLHVDEPTITVGTGDTVTTAATVYIERAPTEGSNNYALFVDVGDVRFDDDLRVGGVQYNSTVTTLDDTGTPSVATSNLFVTGGTTSITDFDDGVVGQTIKVLSQHAITITHGASTIVLNGATNWTMASGDTLTLTMFTSGVWHEVARSDNT